MIPGFQITRNTFLQEHELLRSLSPADRARILPEFVAFRRHAGQRLFAAGDPPDGLYVVERGELSVRIGTPEQGMLTLAELGAGAVIGETGLVAHGTRSATVDALTEVEGWWLSRRRFDALHGEGMVGTGLLLLRVARTVESRRRVTERRLRAMIDEGIVRPSRDTLQLVGTLLGT